MTVTPYEVLQFSSANLFATLSNERCTPDEVAGQDRAAYLCGYLTEIGARTIVVENRYTDGDYLEDFASYYVRCHAEYRRSCKRLHFFSADLDADKLRALTRRSLSDGDRKAIVDTYLGFVVARPLPSAIIGRSVLKTYPPDGNRRHYTVVRDWKAHLFGTTLPVCSLPFQEQDSVLAACATVALWSAFHKTAEMFGTPAPRPATITRVANRIAHRGRPIPSHGLRVEEMCHAISDVGLEPEVVDCLDTDVPLVSLVYAHLKMGLPVILIVDVEGYGLHAITLAGFSLKDKRVHPQEVATGKTCIPMIGLRIDEFYGHDDQIGPFARLKIGPSTGPWPVLFQGSWVDKATKKQLELRPETILIPVYNKIRVTFLDVQAWLTPLNAVIELAVPDPKNDLEWEVCLTTTNDYKEAIHALGLPSDQLESLLFNQQPRFMWRAILRVASLEALELVVDATDMARSFPFVGVLWRHPSFKSVMEVILQAPQMQQSLTETLTKKFLDFLKASLT